MLAAATGVVGVTCLAAGLLRYFIRPTLLHERILLLVAAGVLIKPGLLTDLVGAGLLAVTVASQLLISRPDAAEFVMPSDPKAPATAEAAPSRGVSSPS
jgi:TRAP-type uncharacterized transport system fused permease subunit